MLKKLGVLPALLMTLGAANAQSMPAGFYMDGYVQGEYLIFSGNEEFVYGADITLGYSGADAGSMPIGFELDLFLLETDGLSLDPVILGSVFYDSSFGRISVGKPGAVSDDHIAEVHFGGSKRFASVPGYVLKSVTNIVILDTGADYYEYGARFDGHAGDIEYGLSYHAFQGNRYSVSASGRYAFADYYTVALGVEYYNLGSSSEYKYTGSFEADFGQFGAQLVVTNFSDETYYAIGADYTPFDNVNLTLEYIDIEAIMSYTFAAAGVEYSFMDHGYVGVAALFPSGGSDTVYNIYAGWKLNYGG